VNRIEQWLVDWARLFDSLAGILTFTLWRPFTPVKVTIWGLKRWSHRVEDEASKGEYSAW
jgi:hypothetical protein